MNVRISAKCYITIANISRTVIARNGRRGREGGREGGGEMALPRVNSDVTPRVTRAGMASGLIQKAIQDMTTIRADGMYVWNR